MRSIGFPKSILLKRMSLDKLYVYCIHIYINTYAPMQLLRVGVMLFNQKQH